MSVETEEELEGMLRVGRVVRLALEEMKQVARPGLTTAQVDAVGAAVLHRHGARSAPKLLYGFPGENCISVNDEAVHGIPGDRVLKPGDLLKLDVTAELDGYIADAALTVPLPPVSPLHRQLCDCAEVAFHRAVAEAIAGRPLNGIGRAMEQEVKSRGFSILRELHSHGVGRAIHEAPHAIPNYYERRRKEPLAKGWAITIEPIISSGSYRCTMDADGWTIRTKDGSPSAHYEQTVIITQGRPLFVTA